jgi:hypothetical protein
MQRGEGRERERAVSSAGVDLTVKHFLQEITEDFCELFYLSSFHFVLLLLHPLFDDTFSIGSIASLFWCFR